MMGTKNLDKLAKEVKPKRLERLKKELLAHKVTLSKNFYMANTEITKEIWLEVMGYKLGEEKRWQNMLGLGKILAIHTGFL